MHRFLETTLELNRKIFRRLHLQKRYKLAYDLTGQAASDYIRDLLLADRPGLIARLGSVELYCVLNYLTVNRRGSIFKKIFDYLTDRSPGFWWETVVKTEMFNNAGFFPAQPEYLGRFAELMLDCLPQVDILGSWRGLENCLARELNAAKKVPLLDLEPYHHAVPWSSALRGKKVLVIHPFSDTIKNQYQNREKLFANPDVLPEFQLETIRAVQSIAGARTKYPDWFAALDDMKRQIAEKDFDVAILGCGAYGFPLAAYVKCLGKKAVHLGGALQILFGIKGRRWENNYGYDYDTRFYNEYWVRPSAEETPQNFSIVESGCYW